jgi:hypothetical protein
MLSAASSTNNIPRQATQAGVPVGVRPLVFYGFFSPKLGKPRFFFYFCTTTKNENGRRQENYFLDGGA